MLRAYGGPVDAVEARDRTRLRRNARLALLRRRAALGSTLGFAAFLALAAQHAVGSTKHAAATPPAAPVAGTPRYFDQQSDGFAFDDGSSAPLPPPVAQTSVS
jgi:hypothetical protein